MTFESEFIFFIDELIKSLHLYREEDRLNPFYKNLALWLVIFLMMVMLYNFFNPQQMGDNNMAYSDFLSLIKSDADFQSGDPGSGVDRNGHEPETV